MAKALLTREAVGKIRIKARAVFSFRGPEPEIHRVDPEYGSTLRLL
jgi:hypothetical protein